MSTTYPNRSFDRMDETDDSLFYTEPRLLTHIDDEAIEVIGDIFQEILPPKVRILDLMSSWRSHLPIDLPKQSMIGLGLNATEMEDNPQLDSHVIHNLNTDPKLPFGNESFDATLLTVSVQYLTQPVEVFTEIARVMTDGAPLIITFSNRMFPTKAVRIWQACDDLQRMSLVKTYMQQTRAFQNIYSTDRSRWMGYYTDPIFLVAGRKSAVTLKRG